MTNDEHNELGVDLERQRERLARWLMEWELANALDDGGDVDDELPADDGAKTETLATSPDREAPVQVGHIRLMAPESASLAARPLFVGALEVDAAGRV